MSTALLFPGQGSQTPDMRELVEAFAPELAEFVLAKTGADPFALANESTAYAQPAIVCASLAAWTRAGRPGSEFLAGHSLGELSALAAASAIEPTDAVRLAVLRGRLMSDAAEARPGTMVALLGEASKARAVARESGVEIANDNGPSQLVAAGPPEAIESAVGKAKAHGIRAIKLPVAGAFHTEAMRPAVEPYREALEHVTIEIPTAPVYSSATAEPFPTSAAGICDQLAGALVHPVRWRETIDSLHRLGVRNFVEAGPGRALIGMLRRSHPDVEANPLGAKGVAHV